MKFAETDAGTGSRISGYGPDGLLIGGRRYRDGVIVTPRLVRAGWGPSEPTALAAADLEELLAAALDGNPNRPPNIDDAGEPGRAAIGPPPILIIGTGRVQVFPPAALLAAFLARGIGIEVMDTGAACRTFNILLSEGRAVAAGLLPPGIR